MNTIKEIHYNNSMVISKCNNIDKTATIELENGKTFNLKDTSIQCGDIYSYATETYSVELTTETMIQLPEHITVEQEPTTIEVNTNNTKTTETMESNNTNNTNNTKTTKTMDNSVAPKLTAKERAINITADVTSKTFGNLHLLGYGIMQAAEYGEKKIISRLTGELEEDIVDNRYIKTAESVAKIENKLNKLRNMRKVNIVEDKEITQTINL